ncbi:MAG: Flp family type IVb pilin [Armatimonadetes bacterium]|nr:Flp family type IVb pilin [Armatimonadota bacterium]
MMSLLRKLWVSEEGQTLVEYALILALISIVVIAVLTVLGGKTSNTFNAVADQLQ